MIFCLFTHKTYHLFIYYTFTLSNRFKLLALSNGYSDAETATWPHQQAQIRNLTQAQSIRTKIRTDQSERQNQQHRIIFKPHRTEPNRIEPHRPFKRSSNILAQ